MSPRHEGKPLLRLVDAFVFDAIGHLDPAEATALSALEPQLRRDWNATGDWRAITVQQMQWPEGMAGAIREVWEKGRVRFVQSEGYEPNPEQFVRSFVDSKFPH